MAEGLPRVTDEMSLPEVFNAADREVKGTLPLVGEDFDAPEEARFEDERSSKSLRTSVR
jgi:hypothetical protein